MRKTIEINQKRLSYLDEGEGFPILFGHSYLWNAEMWRPQIDQLKTKFRCIVPDLWGHGESDPVTESEYTIQQLADDYQAFLDALNIEKCAIVGLSVGGMWGTQLTLQNPNRISALVIMDTYVGAEPIGSLQVYNAMIDQFTSEKCFSSEFVEQVTPFFFSPKTLKASLPIVGKFKQSLAGVQSENVEGIGVIGKGVFSRKSLLDQLGNISIPSLVVVGKDDMPRPPREAKEMADLLNTKCIEIEDTGHICNLERPEVVSQLLETFLDKVLAGTSV